MRSLSSRFSVQIEAASSLGPALIRAFRRPGPRSRSPDDRNELLFVDKTRAVIQSDEDRRWEEVAGPTKRGTAGEYPPAGLHGILGNCTDLVELCLVLDRTHRHTRFPSGAKYVARRDLGKAPSDLLDLAGGYVDTLHRSAELAVVAEGELACSRDQCVDRSIGQQDRCVLAPKFQDYRAKILGRLPRDGRSGSVEPMNEVLSKPGCAIIADPTARPP